MRTHYVMLASYNRWATRRVFSSIKQLPKATAPSTSITGSSPSTSSPGASSPAAPASTSPSTHPYIKSVGLPCNSIHGTMCHLFFADMLWLRRLQGQPAPEALAALWSADAKPTAWEDEYASKCLSLASSPSMPDDMRVMQLQQVFMGIDDQNMELINLCKGLSEPELAAKLKYSTTDGKEYTRPRSTLLTHIFNHATHHRGQVSAALSMAGAPYPVLDISAYLPEWEELHGKAFRWA